MVASVLQPAAVGLEEAAPVFRRAAAADRRVRRRARRRWRGRARHPCPTPPARAWAASSRPCASYWPSAQACASSAAGSCPGSVPSAAGDAGQHGLQLVAERRPAAQQPQPLAQQLGQRLAQRGLRQRHGQALHAPGPGPSPHPGPARSTSLARLLHQLAGRALVDGLEMRRHPRLEREPPQQRAAQRVDGHDAQPARQLQHLREQPARPLEPLGGRPARRSASSSSAASRRRRGPWPRPPAAPRCGRSSRRRRPW